MARQRHWYIVVRSGDQWWVNCEGKPFGPFESREDAARNATVLIKTYGNPEHVNKVLSPDDSGRYRTTWRNLDAYAQWDIPVPEDKRSASRDDDSSVIEQAAPAN